MELNKFRIDEITTNLDNMRKPLNNLERTKISNKKIYPYYGANNLMDYIDEYIFDEEILCVAEDGGSWGFNEKCSYIVNEKCWVNNHAHVLRANNNLNLKYLYYYLNYNDLSRYITGTTRGKLTKTALNGIEIVLPQKSNQDKLVVVLDKAQELIEKRKVQIEELDELVKSRFIEMFGDVIINNKKYPIKNLEDITSIITDGTHQTPTYCDSGYTFLSSKNVTSGKINWNDVKYIPEELHIDLNRRLEPKLNDILLAKNGTTGVAALVDRDCVFDIYVSLALIRLSSNINPVFMLHMINSSGCKFQFNNSLKGIGVPNLHLSAIRKTKVLLPPIELQNQFADFVKEVDKLKFEMEKSLKELEDNFNSLMQRAFKGELFK